MMQGMQASAAPSRASRSPPTPSPRRPRSGPRCGCSPTTSSASTRPHLALATRYFAGRVFPPGDARTLNVGGAALSKVAARGRGRRRRRARPRPTAATATPATPPPTCSRRGRAAGVRRASTSSTSTRPSPPSPPPAGPKARRGGVRRPARGAARRTRARYAVKLVTGDMRIGLREGLVEEAIGIAFERPAADVARAVMLLGDLGEVACLVARGESVDRPRYFAPLRFMLASPVADAAEAVRRMGEEVWVEDKYDGIRCQLHHSGGRVALYSRDLNEVTEQFPEVAEAAAHVGRGHPRRRDPRVPRGRVLPVPRPADAAGTAQPVGGGARGGAGHLRRLGRAAARRRIAARHAAARAPPAARGARARRRLRARPPRARGRAPPRSTSASPRRGRGATRA